MPELLLIDVALCAVLIVVAALIVRGHRRRGRGRPPARAVERREPAADPAARPMAARETAVVPGLSADGARPDLGAHAPTEPEPGRNPQAELEPAPEPRASTKPVPVPEPRPGPEPAQEPQTSAVTGLEPGSNGQGPPANGRAAAAEPVTASDPIGSYYDEADRPMSDYLAARGWTGEPGDAPLPGCGGRRGFCVRRGRRYALKRLGRNHPREGDDTQERLEQDQAQAAGRT